MTTYAMWNLSCDVDDPCPAGLDDGTASSASEALAIGKREGWTRRVIEGRARDFCPAHSRPTADREVSE